MAQSKKYQDRIEFLQGTLDMLLLQTLRWGSQHGYGIGQAIRSGSDNVLQVETGSLYPALHRLERQGWIKSEWRFTAAGKKQLASEQSRWNQLSTAIASLMSPQESEGSG